MGGAQIQRLTPRLGRAIEPARTEHLDAWWRQPPGIGQAADLFPKHDLVTESQQ